MIKNIIIALLVIVCAGVFLFQQNSLTSLRQELENLKAQNNQIVEQLQKSENSWAKELGKSATELGQQLNKLLDDTFGKSPEPAPAPTPDDGSVKL